MFTGGSSSVWVFATTSFPVSVTLGFECMLINNTDWKQSLLSDLRHFYPERQYQRQNGVTSSPGRRWRRTVSNRTSQRRSETCRGGFLRIMVNNNNNAVGLICVTLRIGCSTRLWLLQVLCLVCGGHFLGRVWGNVPDPMRQAFVHNIRLNLTQWTGEWIYE